MKKFGVYDTENQLINSFDTYKRAIAFKYAMGREDWTIKERVHRHSTERQKAATRFTESWLEIKFNGNIEDFDQVSLFLSMYLEDAKMKCDELTAEYSTAMMELYD